MPLLLFLFCFGFWLFSWLFLFFFFSVVVVKIESVYVAQASLELTEEYMCTYHIWLAFCFVLFLYSK